MALTTAEVLELVRIRALRGVDVLGELWVQPAILSGANTL